jgi:WD40 repeat protein
MLNKDVKIEDKLKLLETEANSAFDNFENSIKLAQDKLKNFMNKKFDSENFYRVPINNYPLGLENVHIHHKDHTAPVFSLAFSILSKYYASGSNDETIKVYETKTHEIIQNFEKVGHINCL